MTEEAETAIQKGTEQIADQTTTASSSAMEMSLELQEKCSRSKRLPEPIGVKCTNMHTLLLLTIL